MSKQRYSRKLTRRAFLRLGGAGALAFLGGSTLSTSAGHLDQARAAPAAMPLAAAPPVTIHLAATDGHILLPGRGSPSGGGAGAPLYVFGFVRVPVGVPPNALDVYKGNVQFTAPIIGVDQEADVYLTMTNIGFAVRPDLDDAHTIHWHGFPNATAIFDGVPEVSISVPPGRDFPYYYKPHRPGTFIYHCHFEDVEHVQMGMRGIIYVRPGQNGTALGGFTRFAYNDGDGATGYNREFVLLCDELWTTPHDNGESIQETIWPDYRANYWVINGRSYPDTVLPNNDPSLPTQPISALIQANPGERVLLRIANLGYEQHALHLPGIQLKVVGEDAALLRNGTVDLSYLTNTIYVGPGEARDALFTAPAFDGTAPVFTDSIGNYNRYYFKNASPHKLTNDGQVDPTTGLSGMVTEVRIYQGSPLAAQLHPNQTYPEFAPPSPYLDPWIV